MKNVKKAVRVQFTSDEVVFAMRGIVKQLDNELHMKVFYASAVFHYVNRLAKLAKVLEAQP